MKILDKIKNFFDSGSRVKVPTVLQMEAVECGAASLAMILAYYGKWIPLERLRQECSVTRDGSNAENILKAAENLGCVAKGFAGRPIALRKKSKNNFPLILFWEFNHFVVLEGIKGDTVYLNDPAMGRRKLLWEDFCLRTPEFIYKFDLGKISARRDTATTSLKLLPINSRKINGLFCSS